MGHQRRDIDDEDDDYSPTSTNDQLQTPTVKPFAGKLYSMATSTVIDPTPGTISSDYQWGPPKRPTGPPTGLGPWAGVDSASSPSSTYWVTKTKAAPLGEGMKSSQVTTSPFLVSTEAVGRASITSIGYGYGRPNGHGAKENMDNGRVLAAAAITPVVVLILIGALVFFCMRKRKRQRLDAAAAPEKAQEMKMQPRFQSTAQPYMAPVPAVSPSYATSPTQLAASPSLSAPPPIILGPIPSGANGAYFTGIDTSDVISMTSASNLRPGPPNPFSDNDSLAEPPPPYRPRSVAPPSLTNSSRHSSLRVSAVPPATSQTHLIERSPFEDPESGDVVSEISGPSVGRSEDAMSAVSDLSYQNDPVVNRSSL